MSERPHALVTGASRGIGRAVAVELARAGHPVLVNYRSNEEAARATVAAVEQAGGSAELLPFDVRDAEATGAAIDKLLAREVPVGVVVNNAGVARDAAFPALEREAWDEVTRTTLDGFYNVTKPLVMPMIRRRWGRIVSVASISGLVGNRGQTAYSAAKGGLIAATRSLSKELARRGVTVNAVAPGLIETDMVAELPVDDMKKMIPMRRLGRPEDVAAVVGFLASDRAGYVTGQCWTVDGGLT